MDKDDLSALRAKLRPMLMEWVSEQVNAGTDYRVAALTAAGVLTCEAVTIASTLDAMDEFIEMVMPVIAEAAPDRCSVLYRTGEGSALQ